MEMAWVAETALTPLFPPGKEERQFHEVRVLWATFVELHPWRYLESWHRLNRLRIWLHHWLPITLPGCEWDAPLKGVNFRSG